MRRHEEVRFDHGETFLPMVVAVIGKPGHGQIRAPDGSMLRDGDGKGYVGRVHKMAEGDWCARVGNEERSAPTRFDAILRALIAAGLAEPGSPQVAEKHGGTYPIDDIEATL